MDFIPIAKPLVGEEEADAAYKQVKSGWISMGQKAVEFENIIKEYVGAKHAIVFNSGTATLHAALLALGVDKDSEVLVPSLSYISSANAVLYCGARPVFVEENPETFNVEVESLQKKINAKTKAIMTVDLKGMPVDYDAIAALSEKTGIPVIADSAESFGAKYKNAIVGTQAPVHSFSLFANKNITTGEGGIITTHDDHIAEVCRCVRNQGQSERYVHTMVGHNYRMTDIHAAIGIEQLKRIETLLSEKNRIAGLYSNAFASHPEINPPYLPDYVSRHSWYMYCLRLDPAVDRDKVCTYLKDNQVDSRLSFPPIPYQPVYKKMFGYKDGDFPVAERIYNHFIDIPCWYGMSQAEIDHVITTVQNAVEHAV